MLGVVKVNASQCLDLLRTENKILEIDGFKITNEKAENIKVKFSDFLIFENEIGLLKYGKILQAIINQLND